MTQDDGCLSSPPTPTQREAKATFRPTSKRRNTASLPIGLSESFSALTARSLRASGTRDRRDPTRRWIAWSAKCG